MILKTITLQPEGTVGTVVQETKDSGGKGFCLLTTSFWCWWEM